MKSRDVFVVKINGHILTGGPLAMMQLGQKLEQYGAQVILCFDDYEAYSVFSDWCSKLFGKFDYMLSRDIHSHREHHLIVTETDLQNTVELNWGGKIICYMLSIDNCVSFGLNRLTLEAKSRHYKNIIKKIYLGNHVRWNKLSANIDLFIAQSHYALEVLTKSSLTPCFYIGDYIESDKLTAQIKNPEEVNANNKIKVCFNPKKGKIYSKIVRNLFRSVDFIPISGLNSSELQKLFQSCDAYVDFGAQPGKDRLPREAIACGCPAFILMSGAGLNASDFPRCGPFRISILQLFKLKKIIQNGLMLCRINPLFDSVRTAEVLVEESEFSVRVQQLIKIIKCDQ